jgi:glycosyltransferase involved in cell wall biosynthesis
MTNNPAVSIVIPAYNHERYVETAIRSALSQTVEDLELIVIDDASTDATREIVDGFDDRRVRRMHHEQNRGAAATLNEGIGQSRGAFIAILNSDDVFAPNRLERLMHAANETGATFVASDVELVDADGTIIRDKAHWWLSWYDDLKRIYVETGDIVQALLAGNILLTTSNFLVRRDVFDSIGRFNDYRYVLDYEFIFRFLADQPHGLLFLREQRLLRYRLHGGNTIREDRVAPNRETFDVLLAWYPSFMASSDIPRYKALERQLRKVEAHTAEESARLGRKEAEELRRLRDILWEKDMAIEKLLGQLTVKDERIACMRDERDAERNVFRDMLWQREDSIRQLHGFNVEKDAALARLQEALVALQEALMAKDAELIQAFQTSSYRLGYGILQPFRRLRKLLRIP